LAGKSVLAGLIAEKSLKIGQFLQILAKFSHYLWISLVKEGALGYPKSETIFLFQTIWVLNTPSAWCVSYYSLKKIQELFWIFFPWKRASLSKNKNSFIDPKKILLFREMIRQMVNKLEKTQADDIKTSLMKANGTSAKAMNRPLAPLDAELDQVADELKQKQKEVLLSEDLNQYKVSVRRNI
jgi:hypothetical protein